MPTCAHAGRERAKGAQLAGTISDGVDAKGVQRVHQRIVAIRTARLAGDTATENSLVDSSAAAGQTYTYKIRSTGAGGAVSAYSPSTDPISVPEAV